MVQVVVREKSLGLVPVKLIKLKVTVDPAEEVLVTVTVWLGEGEPTVRAANVRDVGAKETETVTGNCAVTSLVRADSPDELNAVTTQKKVPVPGVSVKLVTVGDAVRL